MRLPLGSAKVKRGGPAETLKRSRRGQGRPSPAREVLALRSPKGRSDGQDLQGEEVRGGKDAWGGLGPLDPTRMRSGPLDLTRIRSEPSDLTRLRSGPLDPTRMRFGGGRGGSEGHKEVQIDGEEVRKDMGRS